MTVLSTRIDTTQGCITTHIADNATGSITLEKLNVEGAITGSAMLMGTGSFYSLTGSLAKITSGSFYATTVTSASTYSGSFTFMSASTANIAREVVTSASFYSGSFTFLSASNIVVTNTGSFNEVTSSGGIFVQGNKSFILEAQINTLSSSNEEVVNLTVTQNATVAVLAVTKSLQVLRAAGTDQDHRGFLPYIQGGAIYQTGTPAALDYTMAGLIISSGSAVLTGVLPPASTAIGAMFAFRQQDANGYVLTSSNDVGNMIVFGSGTVVSGNKALSPAIENCSSVWFCDGVHWLYMCGSGSQDITAI